MYFLTDIYNSKRGILFQALNSSALIGQTLLHMVNIIVQHMFFVCFCLHVFLFVPGWDCCQARCQSDHRQLLQSAHRRCFVRTSGLGGLEYFWILKKESSCNRLIASTYQEVVLKMAMKGMFELEYLVMLLAAWQNADPAPPSLKLPRCANLSTTHTNTHTNTQKHTQPNAHKLTQT